MSVELEKVRLHYIYCVYGDSDGPVEEVRDFFSVDVGEDINVYNVNELSFYLDKDGEEYVKFFDNDSPFALWNKAFKREGSEFGYYDDICYFGINYCDALVPIEEVEYIQNQIKKRRKELYHG
jgi:hypothetical protein